MSLTPDDAALGDHTWGRVVVVLVLAAATLRRSCFTFLRLSWLNAARKSAKSR